MWRESGAQLERALGSAPDAPQGADRTILEERLANLNEDLRTLFELTKLDTLFRLSDGGDGPEGAGVHAPLRPPPRSGGGEEALPG